MCNQRKSSSSSCRSKAQTTSCWNSTCLSGHLITKDQRTHRSCRVLAVSIFQNKCSSWKYVLKWPLPRWLRREDRLDCPSRPPTRPSVTHTLSKLRVLFWEPREVLAEGIMRPGSLRSLRSYQACYNEAVKCGLFCAKRRTRWKRTHKKLWPQNRHLTSICWSSRN